MEMERQGIRVAGFGLSTGEETFGPSYQKLMKSLGPALNETGIPEC